MKSKEHDLKRKQEILQACAVLFESKGFHELTIKKISQETTFLDHPSTTISKRKNRYYWDY